MSRNFGVYLLSVTLITMLCTIQAQAQIHTDVDLSGLRDYEDLFYLSSSWGAFFSPDELPDLLEDWHDSTSYEPPDESVAFDLTTEGNEPQVYVDHRGVAFTVYTERPLRLAPDGTYVPVSQLIFSSILPSGDIGQSPVELTDRQPIKIFGSYYGETLAEMALIGPKEKQGPFYAIWPYSDRLSMIRFHGLGFSQTPETVNSNRMFEDMERPNGVVDADGNLHIVWTTCTYCFADYEIRGSTRFVRYTKLSPDGDILISPHTTLGERPSASGNAELFRPEIILEGERNVMVFIDQGESTAGFAVRVNGETGGIIESLPFSHPFVEPDCLKLENGDIAMASMIFELGEGRNIFYTLFNSDMTVKVGPIQLTSTTQQSDGVGIARVEDDLYIAWHEYNDYYNKLVRLHTNGSRVGKVQKLEGPAENVIPYRLRMDSDPQGNAHIVYADGKGSIVAKATYEKMKID